MPPADDKNKDQVTLGQGDEGHSLTSPSKKSPSKTIVVPSEKGTQQKFDFHLTGGNKGKAETFSTSPAYSTAKERFARQIQSVTDREVARRSQPAQTQPQTSPSTKEEGELDTEVSGRFHNICPAGNHNDHISHTCVYRLRSHSEGPAYGKRRARLSRRADSPLPGLGPLTRGRARERAADVSGHLGHTHSISHNIRVHTTTIPDPNGGGDDFTQQKMYFNPSEGTRAPTKLSTTSRTSYPEQEIGPAGPEGYPTLGAPSIQQDGETCRASHNQDIPLFPPNGILESHPSDFLTTPTGLGPDITQGPPRPNTQLQTPSIPTRTEQSPPEYQSTDPSQCQVEGGYSTSPGIKVDIPSEDEDSLEDWTSDNAEEFYTGEEEEEDNDEEQQQWERVPHPIGIFDDDLKTRDVPSKTDGDPNKTIDVPFKIDDDPNTTTQNQTGSNNDTQSNTTHTGKDSSGLPPPPHPQVVEGDFQNRETINDPALNKDTYSHGTHFQDGPSISHPSDTPTHPREGLLMTTQALTTTTHIQVPSSPQDPCPPLGTGALGTQRQYTAVATDGQNKEDKNPLTFQRTKEEGTSPSPQPPSTPSTLKLPHEQRDERTLQGFSNSSQNSPPSMTGRLSPTRTHEEQGNTITIRSIQGDIQDSPWDASTIPPTQGLAQEDHSLSPGHTQEGHGGSPTPSMTSSDSPTQENPGGSSHMHTVLFSPLFGTSPQTPGWISQDLVHSTPNSSSSPSQRLLHNHTEPTNAEDNSFTLRDYSKGTPTDQNGADLHTGGVHDTDIGLALARDTVIAQAHDNFPLWKGDTPELIHTPSPIKQHKLTQTGLVPLYSTIGVQTYINTQLNTRGTQTDPTLLSTQLDLTTNSPYQPHITRSPIFPQGTTGDLPHPAGGYTQEGTHKSNPRKRDHIIVQVDSTGRIISNLQAEDDDSMATPYSIDRLVDQVQTLMVDSSKYAIRANYLQHMTQDRLLTPWATGVQPYPPFVLTNVKLLAKMREVKIDAAMKIQCLAETEFHRLSTKLDREGETILNTLEAMTQGRNTSTIDEKLSQAAAQVGKTKATLQTKLENRHSYLAKRQPTTADWDDYFHYSGAYRRNQGAGDSAFQVSATDRAQADLDAAKEIEAAIREDSEDEAPPQQNHKRKRGASPTNPQQSQQYRIPKRNPGRGRGRRGSAPQRSTNDRDFGRSRPSQEQHAAVYYNTNHRREDRDGRDNSRDNSRDHSSHRRTYRDHRDGPSNHTNRDREQDRDQARDRKLKELLRELDYLRK